MTPSERFRRRLSQKEEQENTMDANADASANANADSPTHLSVDDAAGEEDAVLRVFSFCPCIGARACDEGRHTGAFRIEQQADPCLETIEIVARGRFEIEDLLKIVSTTPRERYAALFESATLREFREATRNLELELRPFSVAHVHDIRVGVSFPLGRMSLLGSED